MWHHFLHNRGPSAGFSYSHIQTKVSANRDKIMVNSKLRLQHVQHSPEVKEYLLCFHG